MRRRKRDSLCQQLPAGLLLLLFAATCLSEPGGERLQVESVAVEQSAHERAFSASLHSQAEQLLAGNSLHDTDTNVVDDNGDMLMLANHQQKQPQQQVAYQAAIISVKGSLAFWRPSAATEALLEEPSPMVSSLAGSQYHFSKKTESRASSANAPGVDGQQPLAAAGQLIKCPPFLQQLASANTNLAAARWPEVLAVEGNTIKLNLVILGHRFLHANQQQQQQYSSSVGASRKEHRNAIAFRWIKNNQQISYNTPKARFTLNQLISENDILLLQNHHLSSSQPLPAAHHYFAFLQNSTTSTSTHSASSYLSEPRSSNGADTSPGSGHLQDSFMLAPHLNEALIARLESSKALDTRLANAIQAVGAQAKRVGHTLALLDDFLASGQSIEWQKLDAYLRFDANSLRLRHLTAGGQSLFLELGANRVSNMQNVSDNNNNCGRFVLEQSNLIQIELQHLNAQSDGGLYQLQVCQQPKQSSNETARLDSCQIVAGFQLHVAQDIPHLEIKTEHLILEPGERMSIKCEATGFTLPQITWFLDNQQLNEHQQLQLQQQQLLLDATNSVHSSSSSSIDSASSNLLKLRIGDFVSTDNHVHSFVNASSVQVADGGFYKCQANNGFHTTELEIRVDVRGSPVISRRLNNMSVLVAQNQLHIQCPYSGYPISSVEWYYRPSGGAGLATTNNAGQQRAKRWHQVSLSNNDAAALFDKFSSEPESYLDADKDPDPDKDEWLSQANSMTTVANSDDYPNPLPDYPSNLDYDDATLDLIPGSDMAQDPSILDYSDLGTDFQQQPQQQQQPTNIRNRKKRDTSDTQQWIKFPQSRRHQIHLNGTLILHDVARSDQGFYRCRVIQAPKHQKIPRQQTSLYSSLISHLDGTSQPLEDLSADSNEFHLTVSVPPVISPFASTEALREGMRNFLTCSVIEGDPPVRLQWLKDNQPIEEHLQQQFSDWSGGRIRVETSNEYTSTLYFSKVDFSDSGNYTCMATNKAASVNYTARMLVNVPPKWIRTPKDVECVAGQSIVIDCQAQAHPNPRVWWEIGLYSLRDDAIQAVNSSSSGGNTIGNNNNNKHDQIDGQISTTLAGQQQHHHHLQVNAMQPPNHYRTIISNSRIHILENASLVIRDVQRLDQGYYLCQAANNFGSLSALIKLTVNVGASFSSKYLMKYVKLNERVELDCDPYGQSPVDIVWLFRHPSSASDSSSTNQRQTLQLNHTSSILQATSLSQNPATSNQSLPSLSDLAESLGRRLFIGTIRTELTHNSRQSEQSSSSLSSTIVTKSSSPIDAQPQQLYLQSHQSVGQQFLGAHPQDPIIDTLEPTTNFEVLKRPGQDGGEFVRLHIKQARRIHSADFICQASNRYGSDEKLIKLLVQEAPDPVREISAVQVDSRTATIAWLAPYNGNSPITSYTVEWAHVDSQDQQHHQATERKWAHMITQQPTATITPLLAMTKYEIRVKARNLFGQSTYATSIGASAFFITTVEEAPAAPPSGFRVIPLSSSSLQLSWLPPGDSPLQVDNHEPRASTSLKPSNAAINYNIQPTYSIKGYYLGYKAANTDDPFVFKTVSLSDSNGPILSEDADHLLAISESASSNSSLDSRQSIKSDSRRLKVIIDNLRRSTKYVIIVQAFNSAGPGPQSDQIEAKTLANDPPPAPILRVGLVTYSSIELQWSFQTTSSGAYDFPTSSETGKLDMAGTNRSTKSIDPALENDISIVDGYHVYYRTLEGKWAEQKVTPETHAIIASGHQRSDLSIVELTSEKASTTTDAENNNKLSLHGWHHNTSTLASKSFRFILDQLACGNSYQIYLVAYNSIGSGSPSQIIRAKTRGSAPIAPRRQDYISVNSTFVQLNFESWMNGGCSITNFEIKYKPFSRTSAVSTQSSGESASLTSGSNGNVQNQWLLLSSNVGPEQRLIELRDLQPQTWYAVLTIAESAAGKTEVQYSFMTLDKWGQLPAEAIEANNLPALFRQSNASIKSILYNFIPTGHVSALTMGACMCLVMFATCLLFAIRRFGGQMKDSASLDSQTTTSGAFSGSGSQYQHHHHHHNDFHERHHASGYAEQRLIGGSGPVSKIDDEQHMIYGTPASNEQASELYSMRASPCKATTATIITGSGNSAPNGSGNCAGGSNCLADAREPQRVLEQSVDLNQFINSGRLAQNEHHQCIHPPIQFQSSTLDSHQIRGGYRCSSGYPESPVLSPGRTLFGTLFRENGNSDDMNRYKTMTCRPVSTFATNTNLQNGSVPGRLICNEPIQSEQQLHLDDYQQQMNDQQQIYSKLRLIYNTHNNYNICPTNGQKNNETMLDSKEQTCDSDTINLSELAQAQGQSKLLARTLMRTNHPQQKNIYVHNGGCGLEQVDLNANSAELNSLMLSCHQQQQQQLQQLDVINNKNNYGQYQVNQQLVDGNGCGVNNGQMINPANGYSTSYCAPSITSGSTSTNTSSSQPTSSSSVSQNSNNPEQQTNLISLANVNNGAINLSLATGVQCQKTNKASAQSQLQQNMNGQQAAEPVTNEQSDYAQPFPPKWV